MKGIEMQRRETEHDDGNCCTECGRPKEPLETLMTAQEVADILGVDISYIKNHATRLKPYIPHVKLGGGRYGLRRFKPSQIAQFIEQQTTVPRRGSM